MNDNEIILETLKETLNYIEGDYICADGITDRINNAIYLLEGRFQ